MSDLIIQNANTLKEALRKPINLFLGAGFSVLAKNAAGKSLPVGNALRDDLVEAFRRPELKDLPLARVCTIIEATRADLLEAYLREVFKVDTFDPAYSIVPELKLAAIFTTNIDNLMPLVFQDSDGCYLNDIVKTGPAFANKTAVDYIPLHGSVIHPEGFTFNPVKIASAFSSDPDRWHFLTQRLQKSPTIFCGYGLDDAGVLEALNPVTIAGREHQDKWLLTREHNEATEAYFSALGFNLIVGDTLSLLNWLGDNTPVQTKAAAAIPVSRHPALRDHLIPDPNSVPVRPIRDFYSGAPPTWDDVFSRRIFKTTHFRSVVEAILGKRDVVVLGMFASGKTTLMMQVAVDIPFDGIKLVCSSITAENAKLMVHALAGNRALIFLDDFAESVEVFNFFADQPSVQVVGFERTYSFRHSFASGFRH
ncbi:MAG: SIR2 family protein [Acidobacteriota bacterium]|nr:SIR2 family protein [Acidobacteriota bacterium]